MDLFMPARRPARRRALFQHAPPDGALVEVELLGGSVRQACYLGGLYEMTDNPGACYHPNSVRGWRPIES